MGQHPEYFSQEEAAKESTPPHRAGLLLGRSSALQPVPQLRG